MIRLVDRCYEARREEKNRLISISLGRKICPVSPSFFLPLRCLYFSLSLSLKKKRNFSKHSNYLIDNPPFDRDPIAFQQLVLGTVYVSQYGLIRLLKVH